MKHPISFGVNCAIAGVKTKWEAEIQNMQKNENKWDNKYLIRPLFPGNQLPSWALQRQHRAELFKGPGEPFFSFFSLLPLNKYAAFQANLYLSI